jgi:hypothetical protein
MSAAKALRSPTVAEIWFGTAMTQQARDVSRAVAPLYGHPAVRSPSRYQSPDLGPARAYIRAVEQADQLCIRTTQASIGFADCDHDALALAVASPPQHLDMPGGQPCEVSR